MPKGTISVVTRADEVQGPQFRVGQKLRHRGLNSQKATVQAVFPAGRSWVYDLDLVRQDSTHTPAQHALGRWEDADMGVWEEEPAE